MNGGRAVKINKNSPKYLPTLAQYMRTKEGQAFALSIMSQLIDGFEVNRKGKITDVVIDADKPIVIDFE